MKRRPVEGRARVSLVGESLFDKLVAQRSPRPDERTAQVELNLAGRKVGIGLDGLASVDDAANRRSHRRHRWSIAQNTSRICDRLTARSTAALTYVPIPKTVPR